MIERRRGFTRKTNGGDIHTTREPRICGLGYSTVERLRSHVRSSLIVWVSPYHWFSGWSRVFILRIIVRIPHSSHIYTERIQSCCDLACSFVGYLPERFFFCSVKRDFNCVFKILKFNISVNISLFVV